MKIFKKVLHYLAVCDKRYVSYTIVAYFHFYYERMAIFMNRSDIISIMAERSGHSKSEMERLFDLANEIVLDTLASGEKVSFSGFGTFEVKNRAAHIGRDPRNGEKIDVAETKTVTFRSGKALKNAILDKE